MINKFKLLLFRSHKRENASGLAPVYCRVTKSREASEFSTGVFCFRRDWNNKRKLIRGDQTGNEMLSSVICQLKDIWHSYEQKRELISPGRLIELYQNPSNSHLPEASSFFQSYIDSYCQENKDLSANTIKTFNNRRDQFRSYLKQYHIENIKIHEFTVVHAEEYVSWLRKKYCVETAYKAKALLEKVFKWAVKKDLISKNPCSFVEVKIGRRKRPEHLTLLEVEKILRYKFAQNRLQQVADLFILQCYTGPNYCDLEQIRKNNLFLSAGMEWFYLERTKTGHEAIIPFLNEARKILEKYDWNIPIPTNQIYNSYLKEIAAIVNIDKKITTRTARKTFGQMMLDAGCPTETVARMLGHADSRTTEQNYVRTGIKKMINDLPVIKQVNLGHFPGCSDIPSEGIAA